MNNRIAVIFLLLFAFALTFAQNVPVEAEQKFVRATEEQEIVKASQPEQNEDTSPALPDESALRRRLHFSDVCCVACGFISPPLSYQCK